MKGSICMAQSLAVKYRPTDFEDVCSQKSIIKILERMLTTKNYANCIEFAGPSGCGKTTLARILGNKINNGKGTINEIDGASNNGVENIRQIIDDAKLRSIDSEYKIYIIFQLLLPCFRQISFYIFHKSRHRTQHLSQSKRVK